MTEEQPNQQRDQSQRQNIPIPDPTVLTTEALRSEIGHLRELLESQIGGLQKDFEQFALNHEERHRHVVDSAIEHLKDLTTERFSGIQHQFRERDIRFDQASRFADDAIKAALAAAKEAVDKSERATLKQLDNLAALIATTDAARQEQIRGVEKRQDREEGKGTGFSMAWGAGIALALVVIGIIGIILANQGGTP